MRKFISVILLLSIAVCFGSCEKTEAEPREISCDTILDAYSDAGYMLEFHKHYDDEKFWCFIDVKDSESADANHLYIYRYSSAEKAKEANDEMKYNVAVWLIFGLSGEWRWLNSGYYGDIQYSSYSSEMIEPLLSLTE